MSALDRTAMAAIGLAAAVTGFVVEQRAPGFAVVEGTPARALELAAGGAVLACAVARRSVWLTGAAVAWFAVEWDSPGAGSPLLFTAGLLAYGLAGPLALRGVLTGAGERRLATAAVIAAGIAGLAAAAFTDPRGEGCGDCPANLLLIDARPALHEGLRTAGGAAVAVALAALTLLVARRLARATPAARTVRAPLLVPVLALAASVIASARIAVALALLALAAGITWGGVRRRRARASIARLVVDAEAQSGGLADALGHTLGDPALRIAYPLADGRFVDADGRPATIAAGPGEAVTAIVGDGAVLAQLVHRAGLLEAPGLADTIAMTARLGLQHERFAAEVRARLADLRASRGRIVAAGDAERSRLERNLHDGAQQQLVALMIDLRVASASDGHAALRLERAAAEVAAALEELRRLAGGLYPPALGEAGLAAALAALAEEASVPVDVRALPHERGEAAAEAAAYFVAAGLMRDAGPAGVTVMAGVDDATLWLELEGDPSSDATAIEDRVGALDGRFSTAPAGDRVVYRVELPCAS